MHNAPANVSTRYGQIIPVLEHTGWTWADLLNTPSDLVLEIMYRIAARDEFEHKRKKLDEQMSRNR